MKNKNGKIISHVPALLNAQSLGPMDLVRGGISVGSAYSLAEGRSKMNTDTISQLCSIFKVPIQEVVEYIKN